MDIVPSKAPEVDPERMEESLKELRDYLIETVELIDFTLATIKASVSSGLSANEQVLANHEARIKALESK